MKIIFFNRFFFPDASATSQILSDLAFHLASAGRSVHVVTTYAPGEGACVEHIRGVSVHRVAGSSLGAPGLFRRGIAYLAYYRGARRAARHLIEAGDVVILKTDPPLLSSVIGPFAKRRGAKLVLWLQDIFPEIAKVYGVPGMNGPIGSIAKQFRDRSLPSADRVVAICDRMAEKVVGLGRIAPERISVIHNWADGSAITPLAREDVPLRAQWNLGDRFVVAYSGNLGRVHEFDTMLGAAAALRDDPDIQFLFIGKGPRLAEVRAHVQREQLSNVRFEPPQNRQMLSQSLGFADVHVSVLRSEFEGLVHPSKLYGIMAAGRPTIFVGDPNGETASIIASTQCGVAVRGGDVQSLVTAIRDFQEDPVRRRRMGENARRAFDERFAMTIAIRQWETLLASLVTP